jgi:hypothetical protein
MSASSDPERDWAHCAHTSDPCTTPHDAGSFRIRTRRTSPVPTDPRRCCCRKRWHANIACDAEFDIDSEQPGDLVGVCSFAYAGEKLLCDAGVLFLAHDLFSM